MSIFMELQAVAARLSREDAQVICPRCGKGRLILIDETPDANFGILGMVNQTLRCDSAACGEVTVI